MSVKFLIEIDNNRQIATNHGFSVYNALKKEKQMAEFNDINDETIVSKTLENKLEKLDWFELIALNELFEYRTNKNPDLIVPVGSVEFVRDWVQEIYRKDITKFETFSREIYESFKFKVGTFWDINELPIFVKPYKNTKLFTEEVIEKIKDIKTLENMYKLKEDVEVLMRKPFKSSIAAEFRVFVFPNAFQASFNYQTVMYHYNSKSQISVNYSDVDQAIITTMNIFKKNNLNFFYSFDMALLEDKSIEIIEFHDGWALNDYGIDSIKYKNFVKGSWKRILEDLKNERK